MPEPFFSSSLCSSCLYQRFIAVGSYHAAALSERARTLIEPGGFACAALSIAAAVYLWFRSVVLASQKAQRNQLIWLIASTVLPHGWGSVGTTFVQTNMPLLTDQSS